MFILCYEKIFRNTQPVIEHLQYWLRGLTAAGCCQVRWMPYCRLQGEGGNPINKQSRSTWRSLHDRIRTVIFPLTFNSMHVTSTGLKEFATIAPLVQQIRLGNTTQTAAITTFMFGIQIRIERFLILPSARCGKVSFHDCFMTQLQFRSLSNIISTTRRNAACLNALSKSKVAFKAVRYTTSILAKATILRRNAEPAHSAP